MGKHSDLRNCGKGAPEWAPTARGTSINRSAVLENRSSKNAPVLSGSRPFWFYVSGVSYGPLVSDPHKIGAGAPGSRAVRLPFARTVSPVTQNQSTTLGHACRLRSPIFPLLCLCFV